ncbi:PREDICTED: uncharacterized protein LOC109214548 [Nicotiana attenuata]|uniref:Uncharacterized protein n=1 Tax=Nicotiana attenuata TaxID=49451 RepID=A0A1J6KE80_NICAT|nr:PREDICTED: uncharacterized protein LOC109214548 [Nicotiana attenuata]OIT27004.1 hypothetical protein A4A49_23526 [Nicotiana attenuata]
MYAPAPPNMAGPASGWTHQQHYNNTIGSGFFGRYFSNLCFALSSCFYFLCCCWALEDCVGRRSWALGPRDPPLGSGPGPSSSPFAPQPPDVPVVLPGPPAPAEGPLL